MPWKRPFITGMLVVAITIFVIISGILLYKKFQSPVRPAIDAVPQNFGLLVQFRSLPDLFEKVNNEQGPAYYLLSASGNHDLLCWARFLDSLSESTNTYSELLSGIEGYAAFIPADSGRFTTLWLFQASDPSNVPKIKSFIYDVLKPSRITSPMDGLMQMVCPGGDHNKLYFILRNGILMASGKMETLGLGTGQLKNKGSIQDNELLSALRKASGKKVDANVFVRYGDTGPILFSLLDSVLLPAFQPGRFAEISAFDVLLREKEVLVNGYTVLDSTNRSIPAMMKTQQPQEISCLPVLPSSTEELTWFGFSDPDKITTVFHQDDPEITRKAAGVLIPWIGNEFAKASLLSGDGKKRKYGIFHIRSGTDPMKFLSKASDDPVLSDYKGFPVLATGPVLDIFSPALFEKPASQYCTKIDDFIVMSDNIDHLEAYLDDIIPGRTMAMDESFHAYADNISNICNILYYNKLSSNKQCLAEFLTPAAREELAGKGSLFMHYPVFSIQLTWLNEWIYTHVALAFDPAGAMETDHAWKVHLDGELSSGPYLITDLSESKKFIAAADDQQHLYLTDEDGIVRWKKDIAGNIVGKIYPGRTTDGDLLLFFSTDRFICCLDESGEDWPGFPVPLSSEVTAGMSLFDYENNGDYRIIVPCENGKVYDYDGNGRPVDGWKEPELEKGAGLLPQHLVSGKKDYILMTGLDGRVLITDRRGKERIKVRDDLRKALGSDYYLNRTNSRGIFITTDDRGHLVYISSSGKIQKTSFGEFSPGHFFLYDDIDGNGHYDFIYLDGKRLTVFDRFKNILISHDFEKDIGVKPSIFTGNDHLKYLLITSPTEARAYIFNGKGELVSHELSATSPVIAFRTGKAESLSIATGIDSSIILYKLILPGP